MRTKTTGSSHHQSHRHTERKSFDSKKCIVKVDRRVIDQKLSDHAIITYQLPNKLVIISLNVMCSGEEVNNSANAFGINPRDELEQKRRFKPLIDMLKESAIEYPECVIALQEYPRREETGNALFTSLLEAAFRTHALYFAPVEHIKQVVQGLSSRIQSQLCLLIPRNWEARQIIFTDPNRDPNQKTLAEEDSLISRLQIVQARSEIFINIHPSSSDNRVLKFLQDKCRELSQRKYYVYIVGDWNKRFPYLGWFNNRVISPSEITHVTQKKNEATPIDHLFIYYP